MKKSPMTLPDALEKGATEGPLSIPGHAEGTYKPLPDLPHPDGKRPVLLGKIDATIDPTPQALKKLRPYVSMVLQIPAGMPDEAAIVMDALFSCFSKHGHVAEGLIGDLLFGFSAAENVQPIPVPCAIRGVQQLMALGYLKLQAPDNSFVDFSSDKVERAWVRYQPSLLEKIYVGP